MMNWQNHIVADPEVLPGKPTIKGSRRSIDHIVGLLAQGWSREQIPDNYPRLTLEDLNAVFAYLYDCLQDGLPACPLNKTAS